MSRRLSRGKGRIRNKLIDKTEGSQFEYSANSYEVDEGDEIDEEQEVTRCVCGQDELTNQMIDVRLQTLVKEEYGIKIDPGLYIQCDQCSVWQHGYCVGLLLDEDVPDKYWCDVCKPDLHIFVSETNGYPRTLYKPINEKRKKLLDSQGIQNDQKNAKVRKVHRNNSGSQQDHKITRKERRQIDEDYDIQLQRALRESAKESGIEVEAKNSKSQARKSQDGSEVYTKSDSDAVSNPFYGTSKESQEESKAKSLKAKGKVTKIKSQKGTSKQATDKQFNNEDLISQKSKPRFVNDKSSIYELRKRTGAILEWLGRSQIELEEENQLKVKLFSYEDTRDKDSNRIIETYNENLVLMEKLTEKILDWEQNFGKYAP